MKKSNTNDQLGKNIKLFRKQKGFTQVELAKALGCSQTIITAYEKGLKKPSVDMLAKLADVLGSSTDRILASNNNPAKTSEKIKNPKLWKKFEQINTLPDTDKRTVFRMIDGLLVQRGKTHA
jgi:transcriptional regulator with XRE-family HTH domain